MFRQFQLKVSIFPLLKKCDWLRIGTLHYGFVDLHLLPPVTFCTEMKMHHVLRFLTFICSHEIVFHSLVGHSKINVLNQQWTFSMNRSHGTKSAMLDGKQRTETSETKKKSAKVLVWASSAGK